MDEGAAQSQIGPTGHFELYKCFSENTGAKTVSAIWDIHHNRKTNYYLHCHGVVA